ncbi:RAD9A-like protein [Mya arenaria]|uniref:RAD9A-like protein n=1 Tax=Mya arenaria TaxID=6604 RepID=A0ABY7E258_MYAAR|nr:RAD9A-like protein [Mya arenaria]
MKCIIPGTNIKVFGRGIHSLSKIGEELYLEPLEHGLALRTVNSSRSAYACFLFAPSFFIHYDDGAGDASSDDSEDTLRCKIAMKSILTVFRSLSTMEKTVERCKIKLNMKESRLVFQLYCRHGIVKTHNLAFIECETLQAVFSKDMSPNSLTASSKLLCDAVMNFQNNQEEITLIVNPEKIVIKNYVDDEPDPNKVMHTNLSLEPDEFDNCQVGVDTEAILGFAEVTTLPLTINFETAGRPIVFTIDSDSTFEGNFVLATLADQQGQSQAQTQPRQATQKRSNIDSARSNEVNADYTDFMNDDTDFDIMIQNDTTVVYPRQTSVDTDKHTHTLRVKEAGALETHTDRSEGSVARQTNTDRSEGSVARQTNTDRDKGVVARQMHTDRVEGGGAISSASRGGIRRVGGKGDNQSKSGRFNSPIVNNSVPSDDEESPVLPMLGTKVKIGDTTLTEDMVVDNADEDEDVVPGTPPAKRFRSLFFGSSQASQSQSRNPDLCTSRVLAPDSDDEN